MTSKRTVDYVVIGGGFYGCCLALFLRSVSRKVVLIEAGETLLSRASRVNQARLHSGFHYPRSMITALKSRKLCHHFASCFPDAVRSDFQMLYAIARHRSKVSANRFFKMFENMDAPIAPAGPSECALFDNERIEAVYRADEYAFDYSVLARHLGARLDTLDIDLRLATEVMQIEDDPASERPVVHLADGSTLQARHVFNVTYAQINHLLRSSGLPLARLKHELTEIVLAKPPQEMNGYAVTVMDGPFFSMMPYPAEDTYSLTHVRYTPHMSWTDQTRPVSPYSLFEKQAKASRSKHMILDAARYMPCIRDAKFEKSIFDVKTVLVKNEGDDGRPILVHGDSPGQRVTSVLGGKIDNIFDLFFHLRTAHPALAGAHTQFVASTPADHVIDAP